MKKVPGAGIHDVNSSAGSACARAGVDSTDSGAGNINPTEVPRFWILVDGHTTRAEKAIVHVCVAADLVETVGPDLVNHDGKIGMAAQSERIGAHSKSG